MAKKREETTLSKKQMGFAYVNDPTFNPFKREKGVSLLKFFKETLRKRQSDNAGIEKVSVISLHTILLQQTNWTLRGETIALRNPLLCGDTKCFRINVEQTY